MRRYIDCVAAPGILITCALAILVLPIHWLFSWVIASFFHELCHYAAVRLCGGKIVGLHIATVGAAMSAVTLSPGQELFCSLAGPLGALLLLPLGRWFPLVVVCAMFQSIYNLLPLYPLDGGRALRYGLMMFLSEQTTNTVCNTIGIGVLILIWAGALYAVIWLKLGIMPLILALILILKMKREKYLANRC